MGFGNVKCKVEASWESNGGKRKQKNEGVKKCRSAEMPVNRTALLHILEAAIEMPHMMTDSGPKGRYTVSR